jgi:hypothetical protein
MDQHIRECRSNLKDHKRWWPWRLDLEQCHLSIWLLD